MTTVKLDERDGGRTTFGSPTIGVPCRVECIGRAHEVSLSSMSLALQRGESSRLFLIVRWLAGDVNVIEMNASVICGVFEKPKERE